MSGTATQRLSPADMFKGLNLGIYEVARSRGLTFSQFLDREMTEAPKGERLDGYQRCLAEAGIITRTHPTGWYQASNVEAFRKNDHTRALFPEFVRRTVDAVRFRERIKGERAVYLSDETVGGSVLRPFDDLLAPREADRTMPAIPLEEVIVGTRFTTSDKARAIYLNRDAASTRKKRVAEGTDLPRAKLTTGQNLISLPKYGIALEATYETMRTVSLDQFARFLQMEAIQAEIDKVAAVIDVMVNGDGNASTSATNYNLTSLDASAIAGTLTLKGWLAFKAKFVNPYMLTHVLGTEATILQLLLLNLGSANVQLNNRPDLGGFTPINQRFSDGVRWGLTSAAPALTIVGFDRNWAVGRLVETGSVIQEVDRWITNQTNVLTATENEGFEIVDQHATKTLTIGT